MRPNPERRYFYARTVGFSRDVLERIISVVQDADLASQIPLVKLERNPQREFYVFLGVESAEGFKIPGGLEHSSVPRGYASRSPIHYGLKRFVQWCSA